MIYRKSYWLDKLKTLGNVDLENVKKSIRVRVVILILFCLNAGE